VGTVALLVPLNCMFAGIGVILDRESGAPGPARAPISRPLSFREPRVALAVTALQVVVLIAAAVLRGAELHTSAAGVVGRRAAALLAVGMYGVAETLAQPHPDARGVHRVAPRAGDSSVLLRGSLFPISALPAFLTASPRWLP